MRTLKYTNFKFITNFVQHFVESYINARPFCCASSGFMLFTAKLVFLSIALNVRRSFTVCGVWMAVTGFHGSPSFGQWFLQILIQLHSQRFGGHIYIGRRRFPSQHQHQLDREEDANQLKSKLKSLLSTCILAGVFFSNYTNLKQNWSECAQRNEQ